MRVWEGEVAGGRDIVQSKLKAYLPLASANGSQAQSQTGL
jgi:hypothetical protein